MQWHRMETMRRRAAIGMIAAILLGGTPLSPAHAQPPGLDEQAEDFDWSAALDCESQDFELRDYSASDRSLDYYTPDHLNAIFAHAACLQIEGRSGDYYMAMNFGLSIARSAGLGFYEYVFLRGLVWSADLPKAIRIEAARQLLAIDQPVPGFTDGLSRDDVLTRNTLATMMEREGLTPSDALQEENRQ